MFYFSLPHRLPENLQSICDDLRHAKDQRDCVERAYDLVSRRFTARRLWTYLLFWRLFYRDWGSMWHRRGFIHCTHLNHFLTMLLVGSGWFSQADIEKRWTILSGFSPHQYLRIHLKDGRILTVDVWGRAYGIPFGQYAHGFNATSMPVPF